MKFKYRNIQCIFLLLAFVCIAPWSYAQRFDPKSTTQKFASALQIINFAYVDTIDEVKLVEKAIVATLKELDPHSQYISKEDLRGANEPLEGNFDGIGISFQVYRDTILVISPVPGGPAKWTKRHRIGSR